MDDSPSGLRERPLQRQPSLAFVGGPGCALPRPPVHLGLRRLLAEAQHGQATRAQLIFGASRGQRHVAPVAVRAGPLGNSVAELTHHPLLSSQAASFGAVRTNTLLAPW